MRITTATPATGFRTAGATTEQLVYAGACVLYGFYPELTTTGTITIRDGKVADASGTVKHVCAIGLTQAGKTLGYKGIFLVNGLTIQLSVATDLTLVQFEPVIS